MANNSRRDFLKRVAPVAGSAVLGGWGWPLWKATDVRSFGATGDGLTLDTDAVNRAITAASQTGGGTVRFSPGTYLCHSIRLQSKVTLYLDRDATILAAPTGGYDAAEPNPSDSYQDFGHSHFHNSLIWGEGLRDIAILGPGLICGKELRRELTAAVPGAADKAISLKSCTNVTLRDFSILAGGHFAILATGVDDLVVENLTIDTNRDGINIDSCRRVRVSDCRVNSPHDDSICLKSSLALGYPRATEDVTIRDCFVTGGYRMGALLDGSRNRLADTDQDVHARHCMMGRIKLGTESNGGFRNILIENCVCERSLGLAFETVDGGDLENVVVRSITMRDIRGPPVFVRLGARLRGPPGASIGRLRGLTISGLTCNGPSSSAPAIISGIPDYPIESIVMRDVELVHGGGGAQSLAGIVPPEQAKAYPEVDMFGALPAQGLFARHVRNLELSRVAFRTDTPDTRPIVWLDDVEDARFSGLQLPSGSNGPAVWRYESTKQSGLIIPGLP
jgi:polygalacturonase